MFDTQQQLFVGGNAYGSELNKHATAKGRSTSRGLSSEFFFKFEVEQEREKH